MYFVDIFIPEQKGNFDISLYEKTAFMSFYVACQQNISLIFMVNKFYEIPESVVNIVEAGSKRQK